MIDLPQGSLAATSDMPMPVDEQLTHVNSAVDWDSFDPEAYREHNYLTLRDDDHQIMVKVRQHFVEAKLTNARGVDVGAGSNLYPALAMLPFCERLDLQEFGAPNVKWLSEQVQHFDAHWDEFWAVYRRSSAYAAVADPRARLREIAVVSQASVFDMPEHVWDLGTMFFVACSLSDDIEEFYEATRCFVRSLKPGAPFAAAFMEGSVGYPVGSTVFPAVRIRHEDVAESLAPVAYHDVHIERVTSGDAPLRDGYSGAMILALGRSAG